MLKDPKAAKIRTESGKWIPATYKSNRYNEWKEKTKITENENDSDDDGKQQYNVKGSMYY